MVIDPGLSEVVTAGIGALVVLLTTGIKDWVKFRREGKLSDNTNLVGNLTKALQRQEAENKDLTGDLNFRTRERDYWQADSARVRFLYTSETGKEPPTPTPPTEA